MFETNRRFSRRELVRRGFPFVGASIFALTPMGSVAMSALTGKHASIDALAKGLNRKDSTFSYDGASAAAYANNNAYSSNLFRDDCTNFVSWALYAGGFPSDDIWYPPRTAWWGGMDYSRAWTSAPDLYGYLTSSGYGTQVSFVPGYGQANNPSNGLCPGDILFYDFGNGITHAAIQTFPGTDPNGYSGDLVDEHTTNRQGVYWSLEDVNGDLAKRTWIALVHIVNNTATSS